MEPISEEFDLGDLKKEYKGKKIKIKKLVKKETGSFTLKDTYISAEDTINNSVMRPDGTSDMNINQQMPSVLDNILTSESQFATPYGASDLNF